MRRKDGERLRALTGADVAKAAELIRRAAGPDLPNDTTKARIARAARALNWPVSRTRDVWHGNAHRIDAHEMDALRYATSQSKSSDFSTDKSSEKSDSD